MARKERFELRLSEEELSRYRAAAGERSLSWWMRRALEAAVAEKSGPVRGNVRHETSVRTGPVRELTVEPIPDGNPAPWEVDQSKKPTIDALRKQISKIEGGK